MRLTESSLVVEPQAHAFVLEVVLESGLFFDHLTRMDRLANDLQKSNMRSCRNYSVSEFIGVSTIALPLSTVATFWKIWRDRGAADQ